MTVTPIALTSATVLPYGNVGASYNQTLAATGAVGSLTWTLASFNYLPAGLSLSPSGSISGTPTLSGQFQFNVNVADKAGNGGTWTVSIAVYPAGGTTSFVAPNGNDSNPGTIGQPYLTIQKCATSLYGTSTCMVRAGTYHETVTPNSGITIMPYNGESVTVDGTDPVANWTVYQGAIYEASVALNTGDTNQLFVGSQMMTEARWPNGDDLFQVNWATLGAGTNGSQLIDINLPNIDWTGARVHTVSGKDPWYPQTATVVGSSPGDLTISLDSTASDPSLIIPQGGGLYYLYGSLGALDKQGEWFYDQTQGVLYFWAPGNVDPGTLGVAAKHRQYCFELSGRSNVTIQNLNLFACSIDMNASSGNNTLDGINARYVSQFTDLPGPYTFEDHNQDSGIILNGSGNVLRNSVIDWSAGNGVALLGTGNVVENNLITNTGYTGDYAGGISLFGSGHEIQNNTVHSTGRQSLEIFSQAVIPSDNDISYNNFFNAMLLGPDGGEIWVCCGAIVNTRIHHNWLHDTQTTFAVSPGYPRAGMYIDIDAFGYQVYQNVLWNNEYFNIFLGYDSSASAPYNNLIFNNSIPDIAGNGYIWLQSVLNCGTAAIHDNFVLQAIVQTGTQPNCSAINNNSTASGATDMTAGVQVGCNFAGCSSSGPPAVSGNSVAPSIALQPIPVAVAAGQSATFTVTAAGSPTLIYQWQRNGANISGANKASYTTPPTAFADNGALFAVQVGNALGSVTSSPAILTIGSTPVLAPAVSAAVNAEGGSTTIAPNTWVAIFGSALAPVGDSRTWQGSDFLNNQMPTQLDGVSVTMNGENAFVYYISPNQVNVLTPPDLALGPVQVTMTTGGMPSAAFTAQSQLYSPSFFIFGAGPYIVATHANGSLLGPASLYPGSSTPAAPGEVVVLYADGFGPVSSPVAAGSDVQSGSLPVLPVIQIGGISATVQFAGLVSPGLFQFNVVVPATAKSGDNAITAQYNGLTTHAGLLLTVQGGN
jgi:uncharacterized protein (TIGR03437 family)